jgi:hypothetical protein
LTSDTGSVRPFGIAVVAIVEIVVAIVGLFVVFDLLYWSAVSGYYGESETGLDLVMGLGYLATSIAGFVIARGLWSLRSAAWPAACVLCLVLAGFDLISVVEWGVTGLDLVGLAVHLSVLAYLNTNTVRALFGRPATTFMQSPR